MEINEREIAKQMTILESYFVFFDYGKRVVGVGEEGGEGEERRGF